MLTRRAVAGGAAAACLAGVTVLAPAAAAAPRARTVPDTPGAVAGHGGNTFTPAAAVQLIKDLHGAWQITHGGGATLAIVGPPVDPATPGLAGKVTSGPLFGHGRTASGLTDSLMAAAVAGQGVSSSTPYGNIGMAPGARVLSLPVPWYALDWVEDEARAIRYAVKQHARVIYVALVAEGGTPVIDSAVHAALARNVVVIASSYRWPALSPGTALYPTSVPGVLTAGAVVLPGRPPGCPGRYRPPAAGSFPVVAPANEIPVVSAGGSIYSLCYDAAADVWLTSTMLMIKAMFPDLPPALAERALAISARRPPRGGFSPGTGFGMINPVGALRAAASLQHVPLVAHPGAGAADPAVRLAAGPVPGTIRAVRHAPLLLGAYTGAIGAGVALLAAAAAVAGRRRRQREVRV